MRLKCSVGASSEAVFDGLSTCLMRGSFLKVLLELDEEEPLLRNVFGIP